MRDAPDPHDPKGLIRESYRIEGITSGECRSIFLDWALSVAEPLASIPPLLDRYGRPDHPMTDVLRAALDDAHPPGRRGGRRARVG